MANSTVLAIGSVIKHRGEYNKDTEYYLTNQVTMYGSVFQALADSFTNVPPLKVASDGKVSLANTATWTCIIDNIELYNKSLDIDALVQQAQVLDKSLRDGETQREKNEAQRKLNETDRQAFEIKREAAEKLREQNTAVAIKASQSQTKVCKEQTDLTIEINTHPAYVGTNGNWFTWDNDYHTYIDSGRQAHGGILYPSFFRRRNRLVVSDGANTIAGRLKRRGNRLRLALEQYSNK